MEQLPGTAQPTAPTGTPKAMSVMEFIQNFGTLVAASEHALAALDRFIQLHNPGDEDFAALMELQAALAPFSNHYRAPAQ